MVPSSDASRPRRERRLVGPVGPVVRHRRSAKPDPGRRGRANRVGNHLPGHQPVPAARPPHGRECAARDPSRFAAACPVSRAPSGGVATQDLRLGDVGSRWRLWDPWPGSSRVNRSPDRRATAPRCEARCAPP